MIYYKLYRRRKYIYMTIVAVGFCLLVFNGNQNSYLSETQLVHEKVLKEGEKFEYKIPKPCYGCPGENGAAVYLNVIQNI